MCKSAYNSYIKNIISPDSTSNPKKFWGFIKGMRTYATGVAPLKDCTGLTLSDSSRKANILNEQFSPVFNKDEVNRYHTWQGPQSLHGHATHLCRTGRSEETSVKLSDPQGDRTRWGCMQATKGTSLRDRPTVSGTISGISQPDNYTSRMEDGERRSYLQNYRPTSLTYETCKMLEQHHGTPGE